MISSNQIMPALIEVCPSFKKVWEKDLDLEDRELVYVCLGAFARHLLHLHETGQTDSYPAVAHTIERLYRDGDPRVREVVTIGLLEGIQNIWGNSHIDSGAFIGYLLPESRKWWEQLNLFWAGKIPFVGATMVRKPDSSRK